MDRDSVFQQCKRHIVAVVDSCQASNDPFPHFILRGFFPADIYATAVKCLPGKQSYASFEYSSKSSKAPETRWRFDMSDEAVATLDGEARELWLGVRDALGCVEVKQAVFRKLAFGLAQRYSIAEEQAVDLPGYALPALFREEKGYWIKPHPDTRKKTVTMQIALAVDDAQKHLGTEFYRRSLNPLSLTREPRGFDIVKTAPYLPNAAYAFVVLNTMKRKSWHGRTRMSGADGVRNTILNLWHAKPEHGHADIVRDHYGNQRAA